MVHNRALVASSINDIPTALSYFDEAASRYEPLNVLVPDLTIDRCAVLLAAGLADDALAEADATVSEIDRFHGQSIKKAELLLVAANCALAAVQPQIALDRAQSAYRMYRSQRNAWWLTRTRLVLVQANFTAGSVSAPLLREANRVAARLDTMGSSDAPQAHLLVGRVALELGHRKTADRHFIEAAKSRRRGPAMARASGWLSEALRAEAAGHPRRLLNACRRGLEVLDEYRFTLGASELRAQATAHGAELAVLAQRHAVREHRPRQLLTWSERWRATALAVPAVRPSANAEINAGLTAFRKATSQIEEARRLGRPNPRLQREQQRLEGVVRACALRAHGGPGPGPRMIDVADLLDRLGPARLAEIVDVDGMLYVLVCGAGKVRQFTAGRTADAVRAADFARFALRRLARSRPGDDLGSALAVLEAAGPRLQGALFGPAVRQLGDGPVIVVPPGKLHAIPWTLLPALSDRVVSVAPSASSWIRAHAAVPPAHRRVTLARGPGLSTDGAEVPLVAKLYDDVTVLANSGATTQKVLYALEGAWVAHIAAHGTFRADSPLFSSLRMHDGPLTVYDFEQLDRAPYRLVLPELRLRRARPERGQRAARPGQQPAAAGHGRHHRRHRPAERPRRGAGHGRPAHLPARRPDPRRIPVPGQAGPGRRPHPAGHGAVPGDAGSGVRGQGRDRSSAGPGRRRCCARRRRSSPSARTSPERRGGRLSRRPAHRATDYRRGHHARDSPSFTAPNGCTLSD